MNFDGTLEFAPLLIQVIVFLVTVGGGIWWLKSALVKQNHQELENLAITRKERIEDLEAKLGRYEVRLANVEGQLEAMRALKAREIALEVTRMMQGETAVTLED